MIVQGKLDPMNIYYIFKPLYYTPISLFFAEQDLQDESQRFDGDKYLASIKDAAKRDIVAADEAETLDD